MEVYEKLQRCLESVRAKVDFVPKIAVVLGSGLGDLADRIQQKAELAAVFSGTDDGGYQYVICSRIRDVAALGREFNRALSGRGGGKNPMVQGAVKAKRKQIEAFLEEYRTAPADGSLKG